MTDALEKAREAAWDAFLDEDQKHDWEEMGGIQSLNAALDAFLSSLKASGLVIVPVEPTEGMVHDGGCSYNFPSVYMGGPSEGAKRNARRIYAAMIAAATPSQPHDPLQPSQDNEQ